MNGFVKIATVFVLALLLISPIALAGKQPAPSATCYLLSGQSLQSTNVTYTINPTNSLGISQATITSAVFAAAETWDNATSKELFNNTYVVDASAPFAAQDGKNTISFLDFGSQSMVAGTTMWYDSTGQHITEFDMALNSEYVFGVASKRSAVYDIQNVVTHELGHALGLNDIYTSTCGAATMYGYMNMGDTSKRTLDASDIAGLQKIYGK